MDEFTKGLLNQGFAVMVCGYLLVIQNRTLTELRDAVKKLVVYFEKNGREGV